jgi:hypothetical protein
MMRGKQPTELDHLASGLGQAADPYMIADLVDKPLGELADLVRQEMKYTAVTMIRAGRVFMAIKKKLRHGGWEDFVGEQGWSWNYVRAAMKFIEVAARFPQTIHLPAGLATKNLLRLPMPQIESALAELPPEAIKKLSPWELEAIYQKHADKNRHKKRKVREYEDVVPEDAHILAAKALSALNQIAQLDLSKSTAKDHDKIFRELSAAWDRAAYNLRDPQHKTVPLWERHPMHDDISDSV